MYVTYASLFKFSVKYSLHIMIWTASSHHRVYVCKIVGNFERDTHFKKSLYIILVTSELHIVKEQTLLYLTHKQLWMCWTLVEVCTLQELLKIIL